jgi:hypothetical protein
MARLMLGACLRGPRVARLELLHLDVDGEVVLPFGRRLILHVREGGAAVFESTLLYRSAEDGRGGHSEVRCGFRAQTEEWTLTPIEALA